MPNHLTVRFAWHDNKWNGKVCKKPAENYYCIGSYSLLSDRIARRRDLEVETPNHRSKIDKLGDYVPPCFWCCNAISNKSCDIKHELPFKIDCV